MGILRWFRRDKQVARPGHVRVCGVVEPTLYYETSDPAELAALTAALATDEGDGGHCMCPGTLKFELETGAKRTVATLHHGVSLRWDGAFANVPLRSPDAVMDWLSARGVTFVREEYEAARARAKASDQEDARWRSRMPTSLAPFFDAMRASFGRVDPAWTAALEHEFPDPQQRAVVLLELFGSGAGPWSGYPAHESIIEQFLLQVPMPVLLAAIGDATTDAMREGAARLFCSWQFGEERVADRTLIPEALRRRLREHVERGGDEDKRQRAGILAE